MEKHKQGARGEFLILEDKIKLTCILHMTVFLDICDELGNSRSCFQYELSFKKTNYVYTYMKSTLVKYSFTEACRTFAFILCGESWRNPDREEHLKEMAFRRTMMLRLPA